MAAASGVTAVRRAMTRIVADLSAMQRPWALVGGLAVGARAEPRTTRDVDIAVAVADDADAESVTSVLIRAGYIVEAAVEQMESNRLATIRLRPPARARSRAIVDLLFASSGVEADLVARATELEILRGVIVPVATVGDLIALKVLSRDDERRPQDAIDLRALIQRARPDDLTTARQTTASIVARGFHRGRDLFALLDEALRRFGA